MPCDYNPLQNQDCLRCQQVRQQWRLTRLFENLGEIQTMTPRLKCWLIFLLNGDSPQIIMQERYLQNITPDLARNIYPLVSELTDQPIRDWRDVKNSLEPHYKLNYQEIITVSEEVLRQMGIDLEDFSTRLRRELQNLGIDFPIQNDTEENNLF